MDLAPIDGGHGRLVAAFPVGTGEVRELWFQRDHDQAMYVVRVHLGDGTQEGEGKILNVSQPFAHQ